MKKLNIIFVFSFLIIVGTFLIGVKIKASTDLSCGEWGQCSVDGIKTRYCQVLSGSQMGVSLVQTDLCEECSSDTWECGSWNECSVSGTQTRSCTKTDDCYLVDTPSPSVSQSCTYEAPGSFDLLVPVNREEGVIVGDRIKIDYYGSSIISEAYLGSIKLNLMIDWFRVLSTTPPVGSYAIVGISQSGYNGIVSH